MAAVAGTIADAAADWLWKAHPDRVIVNNGGDIAIRLAPGQQTSVGVVTSLRTQQIDRIIAVKAADGIGGVCTSGLGGRSFTCGIADAVTVFSSTAAQADALATHLANATFILAPGIQTALARDLDAATDIPHLTVVTQIPPLDAAVRQQALEAFRSRALALRAHFTAAYACVQRDTAEIRFDR